MFTDENYRNNNLFKPCNFVITTYTNVDVDLKNMSELITLIPINYTINNKKNNREKIPYFGTEKVIVGLSFGNERRGIRKGGKTMKGSLGIDIQYEQKNIHIKVSKNNFNIMGVFSEKMACSVTQVLLNHMNMVNELWMTYVNMSEELKTQTINWIEKNILSSEIFHMYNDEILISKINEIENEDIKIVVKYLSMFTYDYPTTNLFKNKINKLLEITTNSIVKSEKKNPLKYKIGNSVYNYKLGVELSMIDLSTGLKNMGYDGILYENWNDPTKFHIMIPLSMINDDTNFNLLEKDKIQSHRFQVNQCGSIRQTSPTDIDTALQVRNMVLKDIYTIITRN